MRKIFCPTSLCIQHFFMYDAWRRIAERRMKGLRCLSAPAVFVASFFLSAAAHAQEDVGLDSGNTAWMLTATALVLLMTLPGLALFYGGLVRTKNALSIFMQCIASAGVMGLLWVIFLYSLAFGTGNAFIGDFSKALLGHVTSTDTLNGTIPEYLFVMFQGMFLIITPALMIGAFAERMRFGPYLAFIVLWAIFVYAPLCHMVWGGGWIAKRGAIDFAGGLVVHMSSGFSALAAAIFLGPRKGYRKEPMPPHNLTYTVIGAALLWVGWFGFNAGSALAANATAALACITTSTATSAALCGWALIEWLHLGKPTVLGAATGAVAGLVAITPACASVTPVGAIGVGLSASIICYTAVAFLKPKFGYDDSLDVFGVHGVGGAWGALAAVIFAAPFASLNEAGRMVQFLVQLEGVLFTAVFAPVVTLAILFGLKLIVGNLRVSEEVECNGLDHGLHSESAYAFGASGSSMVTEGSK